MAGKSIYDSTLWSTIDGRNMRSFNENGPVSNPYLQDHYEPKASEILKEEYPHIYAGYMAIVEEQLELFSKKHLDYGMANISAGTLLATEEERAFALTGLWYRISDKISRWKNLLINNKMVNNEPLTDTYQDIVNYGIIAQLVERGLWKK